MGGFTNIELWVDLRMFGCEFIYELGVVEDDDTDRLPFHAKAVISGIPLHGLDRP